MHNNISKTWKGFNTRVRGLSLPLLYPKIGNLSSYGWMWGHSISISFNRTIILHPMVPYKTLRHTSFIFSFYVFSSASISFPRHHRNCCIIISCSNILHMLQIEISLKGTYIIPLIFIIFLNWSSSSKKKKKSPDQEVQIT
jgi:hypothetical protein